MTDGTHEGGRVLRVVSSLAFWLVLAYFLLAAVVVWLYIVNGARRRDAALRRGEVIADARSKVNGCLVSRPQLVKIDRFVEGVLEFHVASYVNAEALADATPKSDPLYKTRKENAARIRATIPPIRAIHFNVPTVRYCLGLGVTAYGVVAPTVPLSSSKEHP